MKIVIRKANPADAEQILEIYAPIVAHTAISFEIERPDQPEMARRIQATLETHEWLVAESEGSIAGYVYASEYRPRKAYRFSTEVTAYVADNCQGQGVARKLYSALFESLQALGFRRAYAGIALPNDASIALHKAVGFTEIGVFREAGFKFSEWHDVAWWQRPVRDCKF